MDSKPEVYMYILMRTDLASMNPGKAVAQGAHAANACVAAARTSDDKKLRDDLAAWEAQTEQSFGVTISLGTDEQRMRAAVKMARALGMHAQVCHDPTYPLIDGQVCHLIPLDTCAYVFARKTDAEIVLNTFDLMP